jgi:hypothetical protein
MNTPDDVRLKQEFENLREEDRRTVPDFLAAVSLAGARAMIDRRRSRNRIFAGAVLLFAAIAVMMVTRAPDRPAVRPLAKTESLLTWSSPTAFLLDTPGRQLWREVPRLGDFGVLPERRKERR